IHPALAAIFPYSAAALQFGDMHMQHITGHNWFAETCAIHRHEIDELVAAGGAKMIDDKRASRLRNRLNNQNARHDGMARKMPLEEGLVIRDILDTDRRFILVHFGDAITHQRGVAMGEKLQHPVDVSAIEFFRRLSLAHAPLLLPSSVSILRMNWR